MIYVPTASEDDSMLSVGWVPQLDLDTLKAIAWNAPSAKRSASAILKKVADNESIAPDSLSSGCGA